MEVTRRDFMKISGAAAAGLMLGSLFVLPTSGKIGQGLKRRMDQQRVTRPGHQDPAGQAHPLMRIQSNRNLHLRHDSPTPLKFKRNRFLTLELIASHSLEVNDLEQLGSVQS